MARTQSSSAEVLIEVPGDKSISHRAVMLAGIADGESRIANFLQAADTMRSVRMMRALGVDVAEMSATELRVRGAGVRGLIEPEDVIDAGNSGTTIRLGAGLLAGQPFHAVVTGDSSLRRRPMDRVVAPLRGMGALIEGRQGGRLAPLCFRGGELTGIRHELPVASAQVKSALLLAGLRAGGAVEVVEPAASRDHTERMLRFMGAELTVDGRRIAVLPAGRLEPLEMTVPGDFSSAAFFLVLAACLPGSRVRVARVGVNPLRTGLLAVLARMGAEIEIEPAGLAGGEPVADIVVSGAGLTGTTVTGDEIPAMIDEVPALCVAAAMANGTTRVSGASELRVKESDRIASMAGALAALGVECGEFPDGLWINGPTRFAPGAYCDTAGDHRVAMSLAVLGVVAGVQVSLTDTSCIDTSFPGFAAVLARVAARLPCRKGPSDS